MGKEVRQLISKLSDTEWATFISKVSDGAKREFLERYRKLFKHCGVCEIAFNNPKQLQKKYKHAEAFGLPKNYNKTNAELFKQTLTNHTHKPSVQRVEGIYKGEPATFYYEPDTNLTVFTYPNGEFWAGWEFDSDQISALLDGRSVH